MRQRTSLSRNSPNIQDRKLTIELKKNESDLMDSSRTSQGSVKDLIAGNIAGELKLVQIDEFKPVTNMGNDDELTTANQSDLRPQSELEPKDGNGQNYDSLALRENGQDSKRKAREAKEFGKQKPVAEQIFSRGGYRAFMGIEHLGNPYTLKIARIRHEEHTTLRNLKVSNIDFSQSLIEKKGYFIENDTESLSNQEEILKKKLDSLKSMHQSLKRENNDLKIELIEKQISTKDTSTQMKLLNKRLEVLDIKPDSIKKIKANERMQIIQNSLKNARSFDTHTLLSKLISMNKKHTTEIRVTYEQLDKTKEQSEVEKLRLKSVKVVEVSGL